MSGRRAGGLERWVPGLGTVREYRRAWLGSDLVAGLVLTALLVPSEWATPRRPAMTTHARLVPGSCQAAPPVSPLGKRTFSRTCHRDHPSLGRRRRPATTTAVAAAANAETNGSSLNPMSVSNRK
jgi:hypothetical protein